MKILALFFAPFIVGLSTYITPKPAHNNFRLLLVFAGSYLFAITIIHTLPELYGHYTRIRWVGLLVVMGFLLQYLLEYAVPLEGHSRTGTLSRYTAAIPLLVALCVHAFLEGAMLTQLLLKKPDSNTMLLGVVLHRAPIAFILMAVLSSQLQSVKHTLGYLIVFSLASPLGLWVGEYIAGMKIIPDTGIIFLYALMSGSFLYLFSAIIFEKNQAPRAQTRKILVAMLGLLVAVAMEYAI